MLCKHCGAEMPDNALFCQVCGNSVEPAKQEAKKSNGAEKVWNIFSTIGFILGIVSLAMCWIPFLATWFVSIYAIVLSALGKKSVSYQHYEKASKGLKFAIIGTIVSFVVYVIFLIILASSGYADLLAGNYYY